MYFQKIMKVKFCIHSFWNYPLVNIIFNLLTRYWPSACKFSFLEQTSFFFFLDKKKNQKKSRTKKMAPPFLPGLPTTVQTTGQYCVTAFKSMSADVGELQSLALTKQLLFVASVEKSALSRKFLLPL